MWLFIECWILDHLSQKNDERARNAFQEVATVRDFYERGYTTAAEMVVQGSRDSGITKGAYEARRAKAQKAAEAAP